MRRGMKVVAFVTLALAALVIVFSLRAHDAPGFNVEAQAAPHGASDSITTIVVGTQDAASLSSVEQFAQSHGYVVSAGDARLGALSIDVPSGTHIVTALSEFALLPGVAFVEPQYRLTTADVPSDPLYGRQRAYLEKVNAPEAWDIEKGRPDVIVAVLDTGVDVTHADLRGRIWRNASEIAGNGRDDDVNGCVDDVNGCAFVNDPVSGCTRATNGAVDDHLGHGTFVAGIIAASGGNAGMVGVARNVTLMPVRVLDCAGSGTSMAVAQGMIYAAANGADVINISLGGAEDAAIMREAVRIATDEYGALIVAASGNSGAAGVSYPARYDRVLAVGAASIADATRPASFTTAGPEVDVVAVGERIVGTVPDAACSEFLPCIGNTPYATGSGTSFSAPQVSGLAALILSHRPATPPATVAALIKDTAVPVPDGPRADWAGAGLIDMAAALDPRFQIGIPGTTRN
jgi:subtilisin family serine protease